TMTTTPMRSSRKVSMISPVSLLPERQIINKKEAEMCRINVQSLLIKIKKETTKGTDDDIFANPASFILRRY
ncbi:hypothetical protein, partial [Pseudomonas aeruginosa]